MTTIESVTAEKQKLERMLRTATDEVRDSRATLDKNTVQIAQMASELLEWRHAAQARLQCLMDLAARFKMNETDLKLMMANCVIAAAQRDPQYRHTDLLLTALDERLGIDAQAS